MEMWLAGAVEITALRAQLEQLEQAWLPAEADANYWYGACQVFCVSGLVLVVRGRG